MKFALVPFGLLVWSTGLAPNPLIKSISEAKKHEKTHRCATIPLIVGALDVGFII